MTTPRRSRFRLCAVVTLALAAVTTSAATNYVWQSSPNPTPPYTAWETAAHTIQQAVDTAAEGDTVLVTNGVYSTGGRIVEGAVSNLVAVQKPLNLISLNGPEVTIIKGAQDGIRCVYLADGAVLRGFTLTNGSAGLRLGDEGELDDESGGGLRCESTNALVFDCIIVDNYADSFGGGVYSGTLSDCELRGNQAGPTWYWGWGGGAFGTVLSNCVLIGNFAYEEGGGAYGGSLQSCVVEGNQSQNEGGGADSSRIVESVLVDNYAYYFGGGACDSDLLSCTLVANESFDYGAGAAFSRLKNCSIEDSDGYWRGGGAYVCLLESCRLIDNGATFGGGAAGSWLTNCTIVGNSSAEGGGADGCTLINCTLGNNFSGDGGGAFWSVLTNCVVTNNYADFGGGARSSYLNNCTVVGNRAYEIGGGAYRSGLDNCIVYFNEAELEGPNHSESTLNHSCSYPLPTDGEHNITNAPLFLDETDWTDLRLSADSPCIDAGKMELWGA